MDPLGYRGEGPLVVGCLGKGDAVDIFSCIFFLFLSFIDGSPYCVSPKRTEGMPHKQGTVPDKHQRQARRLSTMPCPTLSLTTPIHPPLTVGFVYSYVEDLYGLENTLRPSTSPTVLHSALPALSHSALLAPTWWESVHKHPDRRLCKFLARGLHEGFHRGYQARWTQLRPAK